MTAAKKKPTKHNFNAEIPMRLWQLIVDEKKRALEEDGDEVTYVDIIKAAIKNYLPKPKLPPEEDRRPARIERANGRAQAIA